MSIAYNFDLDVSPIRACDNNLSFHSNASISNQTPKKKVRKTMERTMGTSPSQEHVTAFNASNVLDITPLCSVVGENISQTSDEVIPDSTQTKVLLDLKIVLSAGCCLPIHRHLRTNLLDLGAVIQKTVDNSTTHVVVDRYANPEIVGLAMDRKPVPPMMVDVKWIQDCVDKKQRIKESDYSMRDCQFLKQYCRRLSNFQTDKNTELDETNYLEMSCTNPIDLIEQINMLSERLDALLDHVPIIRFAYHSPDCPSRRKSKKASNLDFPEIRAQLSAMSERSVIKRRRSFGGFVYEYRAAENDYVMQKVRENRDDRIVWNPETNNHNRVMKSSHFVNDMRKTVPNALPIIRETLRMNGKIKQQRINIKTAKKIAKKSIACTKTEDDDIRSAMASLTICDEKDEQENIHPEAVKTKSTFINNLMINESDDFISDVSAYFSKTQHNVVFSGFNKDCYIENKLKKYAKQFKIGVTNELTKGKTRCVVSKNGKRTLLVLKAICNGIPIVKPQWLEESYEESKLLNFEGYFYEEWKSVIENRRRCSRIFRESGSFLVFEGCQPPKNEICWMIKMSGGKITESVQDCSVIIAPNGVNLSEDSLAIPIVTPLFIIDSITSNRLLSFDDYLHQTVINIE